MRLCRWFSVLLGFYTAVFSPGYVHPDEMFQAMEIAVRDVRKQEVWIPWEWRDGQYAPCRSVAFAFIAAHAPLFLLPGDPVRVVRAWTWALVVLGQELLLRRVWARCGYDVDRASYLFRTSWPVLVWMTRPLSNVYETFAFGACALAAFDDRPGLLGALTAVATFWRPTILAFVAPLGIFVLLRRRTRAIFVGAGVFAVVAGGLVALDSLYFGRLVVTPLNHIVFNSSKDRLRQFGLHPRYTHLLLNLPLLFGPLVWFRHREKPRRRPNHHQATSLRWSSILGLLVLSTAPRQEARFLLPMTIWVFGEASLVVDTESTPWLVANLGIWAFYTHVHQAGLLPMLRSLDNDDTALILGAYLAPRSLLKGAVDVPTVANLDDDALDAAIATNPARLVFACAASVPRPPVIAAFRRRGFHLRRRTSWSHFSGEFLPRTLADLRLVLYDAVLFTNATCPRVLSSSSS